MKSKIIALYLPQFHETEENNRFWGKGFTDWVTTKKAKPLFNGHNQPNIPLNGNYYDLSVKQSIAWQISLAKEYGIYGFGIYHYWFSPAVKALTRPVEIIRDNKELDMPFFFVWDNASWKRTWSKISGNDWAPVEDEKNVNHEKGPEVLLEFIVGGQAEWKKHFEYLLPYFKDYRYMKHDNKPIFSIFGYSKKMAEMEKYWNELAIANGFSGIYIIYKYHSVRTAQRNVSTYFYEPHHVAWESKVSIVFRRLKSIMGIREELKKYDYDNVWQEIIQEAKKNTAKNRYFGAFVNYDDTPRRGNKGKLFAGATPQKFGKYFGELLKIANEQKKEYVFLTAWNEWGEGAYLEPDERNGYAYLEAVRDALIENDAMPKEKA